MKPQVLLLIVLGLLFGPGYYAFCAKVSGKPGQTYAMTERGNRWSLPDGSILRLRGGMAYKPLPLELTPDSNGYRMRFTFNVTQADKSGATNQYEVSLLQGDINVMQRSIEVKGDGKVEVALDPLRIFYPGSYLLVLEEVGTPALTVSGVGLQLDTGVETPRMWIAWSGLALLIAGVGILLRDAIIQARRRR
ncbi:MAG TPA: hypothetical protein VHM90_16245 [Phycisphaerae bacterium]|nr:hypothetical protein [Phycisphaerae bacterium]HVY05559.1 hypothetical protein [Burkholderiales bacterium]